MNLKDFGKKIKRSYGSIGSDLLVILFYMYKDDNEDFNKYFDDFQEEEIVKRLYLYNDLKDPSHNFIIFGYKCDNIITGSIIAKGENSIDLDINDFYSSELDTLSSNDFKILSSEYIIKTINELNLKTK